MHQEILQLQWQKLMKKKILAAKQKQLVMYKTTLIRLSANILAEILQAKREWHNIFKGLKEKKKKKHL